MVDMKQLEIEFTKSEWHHQQVYRDGLFAIYKRWKGEGSSVHFEAIRIKENPAGIRFNKEFEAAESYPGENMFGRTAFSCPTYDRAMERLKEMKANSLSHSSQGQESEAEVELEEE